MLHKIPGVDIVQRQETGSANGSKRGVAPVHREGLEFEQVEEGQR
jgi:hypothetical protein